MSGSSARCRAWVILAITSIAACSRREEAPREGPLPTPGPIDDTKAVETKTVEMKVPAASCTVATPVRDHRDEPPTAELFGEIGMGPTELARLRGQMSLADARCLSPNAIEMNEKELFLASGVLYDLTVPGDALTGTGLSLQESGVVALVAAWGPAQQHDCWFARDRHRRACLGQKLGDYPWRRLAFEDVTPLALLLDDTPGRLADLPVLVGVPVDELMHLRVRGSVVSQPPRTQRPGRSGRLDLPPSEWGYGVTQIRLDLVDDPKLTVHTAWFSVPYVDAASRSALFDVLVARWAGGTAPPEVEKGAHVFHAADPRVVVRDRPMLDGGSWDVTIER